jgi:aspartate racemase
MRTIGLIGGMSWESTVAYYQHLNRLTAERLGPLHSARLVLCNVDFDEIETMQRTAQWEAAGEVLANAARSVEAAGADFLVLCTNTMHKVADAIGAAVDIPLLHIVDPTGVALCERGFRRVGLLATRYTMEDPFYRECLDARFGIEAIAPGEPERTLVHDIIYEELCRGRVLESSRRECLRIIDSLAARGCEGIVLACTEIGLLVGQGDTDVPLFDTTFLHAQAAVSWALDGPTVTGMQA